LTDAKVDGQAVRRRRARERTAGFSGVRRTRVHLRGLQHRLLDEGDAHSAVACGHRKRRGRAGTVTTPMIDEAFLPFATVIEQLVSFRQELVDADAGVRWYGHTIEIELPVEFDVVRDADGQLQIGSTPPLYYVDTSFRPSFHRLRLKAELDGESYGD